MARNLDEVIVEMLTEIPESEQDLIIELRDNLSSVVYAAPELISMWWQEVYSTLWGHMPEHPTEEWQYKILSIYSTKSMDELRKIF